ncbi:MULTISPECIES: hypothetical protein [unclassified Streptomyces]|uniref:hypothetical protein n=1 Tax=Streptomyces sp. SID4948 TaxID=2690287 RepID=UPI001F3EA1E0|nr:MULTISPECIES: hypothetical protein [unclassified Streptomyces]
MSSSMIVVESSSGTSCAPLIVSGLGRVPVSTTITGAPISRVPPSLSAISTVLGPVKRASPSISSSPSCVSRLA